MIKKIYIKREKKLFLGGELFQTLVTNPISIFMTHMPNYCYDRLAEYTFESVVNFASCYTNLGMFTTY